MTSQYLENFMQKVQLSAEQ